ncbi:SDR family oxidoreductase [bacterium]|nr:MAG: SDR family oxidoreductase [bacterium]
MVAVITGGAQGIGAAIAQRIRNDGGTAVVVDRQTEKSDVQVDLADPIQVSEVCAEIVARYPKVDLLVNNAGIGGNWVPIERQSLEDWDRTIGVNLRAAYLMVKGLLPSLAGGSIVNIASTRALMSEPNTEAYAASKGGLVALTQSLAVSLADRSIRVNCISPGWIETGDYQSLSDAAHAQHPAGRVGRPEDVAEAVLYLAGASFVTGANLVLDGGMTRKMLYIE